MRLISLCDLPDVAAEVAQEAELEAALDLVAESVESPHVCDCSKAGSVCECGAAVAVRTQAGRAFQMPVVDVRVALPLVPDGAQALQPQWCDAQEDDEESYRAILSKALSLSLGFQDDDTQRRLQRFCRSYNDALALIHAHAGAPVQEQQPMKRLVASLERLSPALPTSDVAEGLTEQQIYSWLRSLLLVSNVDVPFGTDVCYKPEIASVFPRPPSAFPGHDMDGMCLVRRMCTLGKLKDDQWWRGAMLPLSRARTAKFQVRKKLKGHDRQLPKSAFTRMIANVDGADVFILLEGQYTRTTLPVYKQLMQYDSCLLVNAYAATDSQGGVLPDHSKPMIFEVPEKLLGWHLPGEQVQFTKSVTIPGVYQMAAQDRVAGQAWKAYSVHDAHLFAQAMLRYLRWRQHLFRYFFPLSYWMSFAAMIVNTKLAYEPTMRTFEDLINVFPSTDQPLQAHVDVSCNIVSLDPDYMVFAAPEALKASPLLEGCTKVTTYEATGLRATANCVGRFDNTEEPTAEHPVTLSRITSYVAHDKGSRGGSGNATRDLAGSMGVKTTHRALTLRISHPRLKPTRLVGQKLDKKLPGRFVNAAREALALGKSWRRRENRTPLRIEGSFSIFIASHDEAATVLTRCFEALRERVQRTFFNPHIRAPIVLLNAHLFASRWQLGTVVPLLQSALLLRTKMRMDEAIVNLYGWSQLVEMRLGRPNKLGAQERSFEEEFIDWRSGEPTPVMFDSTTGLAFTQPLQEEQNEAGERPRHSPFDLVDASQLQRSWESFTDSSSAVSHAPYSAVRAWAREGANTTLLMLSQALQALRFSQPPLASNTTATNVWCFVLRACTVLFARPYFLALWMKQLTTSTDPQNAKPRGALLCELGGFLFDAERPMSLLDAPNLPKVLYDGKLEVKEVDVVHGLLIQRFFPFVSSHLLSQHRWIDGDGLETAFQNPLSLELARDAFRHTFCLDAMPQMQKSGSLFRGVALLGHIEPAPPCAKDFAISKYFNETCRCGIVPSLSAGDPKSLKCALQLLPASLGEHLNSQASADPLPWDDVAAVRHLSVLRHASSFEWDSADAEVPPGCEVDMWQRVLAQQKQQHEEEEKEKPQAREEAYAHQGLVAMEVEPILVEEGNDHQDAGQIPQPMMVSDDEKGEQRKEVDEEQEEQEEEEQEEEEQEEQEDLEVDKGDAMGSVPGASLGERGDPEFQLGMDLYNDRSETPKGRYRAPDRISIQQFEASLSNKNSRSFILAYDVLRYHSIGDSTAPNYEKNLTKLVNDKIKRIREVIWRNVGSIYKPARKYLRLTSQTTFMTKKTCEKESYPKYSEHMGQK